MADVNIVGKISVDASQSVKSISDLKKEINEAKKSMDDAKIGSKEYNDSQARLKKSTSELSEATGKQTTAFGGLKQGLSGLAPGLEGAATGAAGLGKQLWLLVANPIGAVVAAIVGVFALLYETLKKFDPVMDAIEQGFAAVTAIFNTLLDGVLSLITGAKSLGEVFSSLGSDIKEAAKEAVEFTKVQQDLDDLLQKSTVNQAKYNRQINELILQSKDRTKTEAQRIALIDSALKIEEKAFIERKKIADSELLIAQNAIISGKNLTAEQKRQLKEKGVDYAINLKETKRVTDDEINALADALAKKEDIENQSVSLREKALNRKYALEDAAIAKEQALTEKAEAARQKAIEKRQKDEEAAKAKRAKEDEEYFKGVLDRVQRDQLEVQSFNENIASFDKQLADEKELLRQQEVAAEVQKGKDLQSQVEFQKTIDNSLLETKKQNQSAAIALTQALIEVVGRQSVAGKALAAGLAAIDTFQAITGTLKSVARTPAGAIPGFAIAQAVATGIFGLLNVKKILSTPLPGGGGGGGSAPTIPSGGSASAPLAPRPTTTALDAASIQGVGQASQGGVGRTFVLDADIKSSQERQARLERAARI